MIKKRIRKYLANRNARLLDAKLRLLAEVHRSPEIEEIADFRLQYGPHMLPYDFIFEIQKQYSLLTVHRDGDDAWLEVFGNKIYWPHNYSDAVIKQKCLVGISEQHDKSPHRYLYDVDNKMSGDTVVLAGASDSLFAVKIVSGFKRIILCEPSLEWHSCIHKTMQQFDVEYDIVAKYIGDGNSSKMTTLDSLLQGEEDRVDFIQADIEGSELRLLLGSNNIFATRKAKASICCYHTNSQESEVTDFFKGRRYQTSFSPGYIDPMTAKPLQYPYLRRGVVYAAPLLI